IFLSTPPFQALWTGRIAGSAPRLTPAKQKDSPRATADCHLNDPCDGADYAPAIRWRLSRNSIGPYSRTESPEAPIQSKADAARMEGKQFGMTSASGRLSAGATRQR